MTLAVFDDHFSGAVPEDRKRALFKNSVRQLEIEVFTYCNRTCWFCPNSKIDRRSKNQLMDEALYLRILSDLASVNYDKAITYSRYNEPLSDRIILERIRQARSMLPDAFLFTHTNGDYLNARLLDELRDSGLNQLKVQVYLGANDRFSDTAMLTRMTQRLADLGLRWEFTQVTQGARYAAKVRYDGMDVSFEGWNYDVHANDRGQTIAVGQKPSRVSPCLIPFTDMYIDYNGSVTPCCNIRSDEPTHKPYLVGNLAAGKSIFDVYASKRLAEWRKSLLPYGEKAKPCDTCQFSVLPDTAELRGNIGQISRQFGLIQEEAEAVF